MDAARFWLPSWASRLREKPSSQRHAISASWFLDGDCVGAFLLGPDPPSPGAVLHAARTFDGLLGQFVKVVCIQPELFENLIHPRSARRGIVFSFRQASMVSPRRHAKREDVMNRYAPAGLSTVGRDCVARAAAIADEPAR